jgi:apolipoprotein N-acyltransferase
MSVAEIRLPAWSRTTLAIGLAGSAMMWAALPPLALGWLGWIAPVPWLLLVRANELPGRRPYRSLYSAGCAFWLAAIYWLSLPHPAVIPLWIILAAYLSIYLPVFVSLSRVAVHRLRMPLWVAAPIVWTGLELARAHLLTGFLMGSLAHTQAHWTKLIQISDLFGEYGVDFLVMLGAACIATALPAESAAAYRHSVNVPPASSLSAISNDPRFRFHPLALIPAAIAVIATLVYGNFRVAASYANRSESRAAGPRVALIQGNALALWKTDDAKQSQIMRDYIGLSEQAIAKAKSYGDKRPLDLIVWPETMYRNRIREFEPGFQLPTDVDRTTDEIAAADRRELIQLAGYLHTPILVGIDRVRFLTSKETPSDHPPFRGYNSAALVTADGKLFTTYDKMHLVMFGEYVPFARWVPFLNQISTLTGNVEAGDQPVAMCTGGYCFVPNICYETVFPHTIRSQVATLERNGEQPDVLVNITNDAWYWGSSGLDMHLACGVFRAVETRLPLVIAANGGISAYIDSLGRIQAQSPRSMSDVIVADVEPGSLQSWYVRFGDWFAGTCLLCCVALAIISWRRKPPSPSVRGPG